MLDQLTYPAQFAPLIVGAIFLSIGVNWLIHSYRFKKTALKVSGIVKAIEKYTSITRHDGHKAAQIYYRPLIEYEYDGKQRTTYGASVNAIRHTLGQKASVLVRVSEDQQTIQDAIEDSITTVVSTIFGLAGLVALGVYIYAVGGSWTLTLIVGSSSIAIGHMLSSMLLDFDSTFIKSESTNTPKNGSELIDTKAKYQKEMEQNNFWGHVIVLPIMLGAVWTIYSGMKMLPQNAQIMLFDDFSAFYDTLTSGAMPSAWETPLMICGIGAFFLVACTHSLLYMRGTYKKMKW